MLNINQKLLSNRSIFLNLSLAERTIGLDAIVRDWKSYLNCKSYFWNLNDKYITELAGEQANTCEIFPEMYQKNASPFETVIKALETIYNSDRPGIYIVENINTLLHSKNLDVYEKERLKNWIVKITSRFHDYARGENWSYLVLLGTTEEEWELKNIIPEVRLPFPSIPEIQKILQERFARLKLQNHEKNVLFEKGANILSGLTEPEIDWGINLQVNQISERTSESYIQGLLDYKIQKLRNMGLDFLQLEGSGEIGGMDLLKKAISNLENEFSSEAKLLGIPLPKGWLLAGVPGSGKSWAAKVMAQQLNLPLIYIPIDKVLSKGASYLARVLKLVEASSPNICYFDEFDKLFPKEADSRSTEILGVMLTWLQEKKGKTFALATLNRLDVLPPEMTRAGRFDAVYYVGFPQPIERQEIFRLHLRIHDKRYNEIDFEITDWVKLLNCTNKFTGAEIASVVQKSFRYKYEVRKDREKLLKRESKELKAKIYSMIHPSLKKKKLPDLKSAIASRPELLVKGSYTELMQIISKVNAMNLEIKNNATKPLEIEYEDIRSFAENEISLYERNPEGVSAIENIAREVCQPVASRDTSGLIADDLTYWPAKPVEKPASS